MVPDEGASGSYRCGVPFSSLIFLVIIAIWAAYLIQHWIRRRDHVATARSVDRFSEAMRVLERRQSIPRVESTSSKRSYQVAIARPAHPDVVVKRAQSSNSVDAVDKQNRGTSARGRRLRLIGGLLLFAAGVALALTGVLAWWAAAIGGVALLGSIGSMRASIARERRRREDQHHGRSGATPARGRRARGGRSRKTPRPAAASTAPAGRPARRRPAIRKVTNAPVASARVRGSAPLYAPAGTAERQDVAGDRAVVSEPELYDIDAAASTQAPTSAPAAAVAATEPAAAVSQPAPADGTWHPVDVPRPTYTMKAKAHRSQVSGSTTTRSDARHGSGPADAAPAAAKSSSARRTSASSIADLPFDGNALALDEEFEELPAVRTG